MDEGPALANRLFHNAGNDTPMDVNAQSGADAPDQTIGVAYADYDLDGWTQLVIGNLGVPYKLFRNQALAASGNRWMIVRLTGNGPVNRDAIGANAQVRTVNGVVQLQEDKSSSSLGSRKALGLYLGLGSWKVEALTVTWPGGFRQFWSTVPTNTLIDLVMRHQS